VDVSHGHLPCTHNFMLLPKVDASVFKKLLDLKVRGSCSHSSAVFSSWEQQQQRPGQHMLPTCSLAAGHGPNQQPCCCCSVCAHMNMPSSFPAGPTAARPGDSKRPRRPLCPQVLCCCLCPWHPHPESCN
jgi:hypothetical protein